MGVTSKEGEEHKNEIFRRVRKRLYLYVVSSSLSSGLSGPFLGVYAARLGASPVELGLFHSLLNLSANVMQVFWGYMADKIGRYKLVVFIFSLAAALLWAPVIASKTATEYIAFVSLQALVASASGPAWTALLGLVLPHSAMGASLARLSQYASFGSMVSTLAAGMISLAVRNTALEFTLPFALSAVFGVVAAVSVLMVREPSLKRPSPISTGLILRSMRANSDLVRFVALSSLYGASMSVAWPMFTRVAGVELGFGVWELSILTVTSNLSLMVAQQWAGSAVDKYGRRIFIVLGRTLFVVYPVVYALVPGFWTILATNAIMNVVSAFLTTALQAYLLDVTPEDARATYVALYNMALGISFSLGSLAGGFLSSFLDPVLGTWYSTRVVFALSAVLRVVTGLLHLRLREVAWREDLGSG